MMKSMIILTIVFLSLAACVIPVAASENSLDIILKGTPDLVKPGGVITYDIWYYAQVYQEWFADHLVLFFWFDPQIEIISAPAGCSSGYCDFTPGLIGEGWLSELIGGTFIAKVRPDALPNSVLITTAELWNCLEPLDVNALFSVKSAQSNPLIISDTSTSVNIVQDQIPVPEFPNPVPVILTLAAVLTVVRWIKKEQ